MPFPGLGFVGRRPKTVFDILILPGYNYCMNDAKSSSLTESPPEPGQTPCTAFEGHRCIASGPLAEVAREVKSRENGAGPDPILVFNDLTGRVIDLDLRGTADEVVDRVSKGERHLAEGAEAQLKRGPGRPKLGVIAREVTLLPDQWDWLDGQPGGASAALRRLVLTAKRSSREKDQARQAQEAVYRFMTTMAGNFPGFEEALRAFYRRERSRLVELIAPWPKDVRNHVKKLVAIANRDQAAAQADKSETTPS
jgi:uncharacterized protein